MKVVIVTVDKLGRLEHKVYQNEEESEQALRKILIDYEAGRITQKPLVFRTEPAYYTVSRDNKLLIL